MWIPLELVNYIFYLANHAKIVYYDKKKREFAVKIDTNHETLKTVRNFYQDCKIFTKQIPNNTYPFLRETQICFPPKKKKSCESLEDYETTHNSMITIVDECISPKTETNIIHSWNRYFVMNTRGGQKLNGIDIL
jgi:hypothetical protein